MYHPLLDTIFNAYEENFVDDPEYYIRFYDDNAISFEVVDVFDEDYLYKYEIIAARYIAALVQQKQYKKAIIQAEKVLGIIDSHSIRLGIEHAADSPYSGIIYQRAIAKYNSYVFRSARSDFEMLLKHDPESENIKRWFFACKYYYYEYFFLAIGCSLTLSYWLIKQLIHPFVGVGLLSTGIICCIISVRYSLLTRRKLKKMTAAE